MTAEQNVQRTFDSARHEARGRSISFHPFVDAASWRKLVPSAWARCALPANACGNTYGFVSCLALQTTFCEGDNSSEFLRQENSYSSLINGRCIDISQKRRRNLRYLGSATIGEILGRQKRKNLNLFI